jgi:hypothetical protein
VVVEEIIPDNPWAVPGLAWGSLIIGRLPGMEEA